MNPKWATAAARAHLENAAREAPRAERAASPGIRIRRCNGNKACWCAVCGPHDFLMGTSYSLDTLVYLIQERHAPTRITLELET